MRNLREAFFLKPGKARLQEAYRVRRHAACFETRSKASTDAP